MPRRRLSSFALALALGFALARPASADVIHLKDGGALEGTAKEDGAVYVITLASGATVRVPKDKVDSIEAKPLPARPPASAAPAGGPAAPGADKLPAAPESPKGADGRPLLGWTYSDPFQGFRIRLPYHWIEGKAGQGAAATFTARSGEGYLPRLAVLPRGSGASVVDAAAQLRQQFAAGFPGITLLPDRPLSIGGRSAIQFEATFNSEGNALHGVQTCIEGAGVKYFLLFTGPQSGYEPFASAIKASIESFQCLPLDAVPADARDKFRQSLDRGMAAYKTSHTEDAVREFQAAAAAVPQHPVPHRNLAALYGTLKNVDAALKEYQALVNLTPDNPEAWFNLASMYRQKQKYEDATATYEKVLLLDPEFAEAHMNLGALYELKGQTEKALASLKRAVELDPNSASAHFNLGQVHLERADGASARREFERTLELAPDHKLAKEQLEKLKQLGK
ncbi:MAG: tetratricopeptide repeat protein [Planctomycetes bacterium]|nr:tetratricopeptide repeat protein [Planctomycetota bacterium]